MRGRILLAAQELFDRAGIDGVSMRGIGAKVGLTPSALYAYFPAKIDLLGALWWDAARELHNRMEDISRREPDPVAAIRALANAYAEFALENPARLRVLFLLDSANMPAELGDSTQRQATYNLIRQRTAEAIGQGRLRLHDPDLCAQAIWTGMHGVLTLASPRASFPFLSPRLLASTVIDALLAGLSINVIGGKTCS